MNTKEYTQKCKKRQLWDNGCPQRQMHSEEVGKAEGSVQFLTFHKSLVNFLNNIYLFLLNKAES
jgi:hypothetical protein